jgi:hypothetical protein
MNVRKRLILIATIAASVLGAVSASASELREFYDSTQNIVAGTHISSANTTGWNDPTIYTGDLIDRRYHILVAIKDTLAFQSIFVDSLLDSAKLSMHIAARLGSPDDIDFHFIRRDSTGAGVYPAYDDSRSHYCRSEWYNRKGALSSACPDSIGWETPGATGPGDFNPVPFATLTQPQVGNRYDVDVTPWIAGLIGGTDSVSNGILMKTSEENGDGTDFIGIRHIWPFTSGDDKLILKVWISPKSPPIVRRAYLDNPSPLK